jgi:hypothetical protein
VWVPAPSSEANAVTTNTRVKMHNVKTKTILLKTLNFEL